MAVSAERELLTTIDGESRETMKELLEMKSTFKVE
jgi:hypothetical protein